MGLKCQESKMASRPPRQILPKGGKSNMIFFLNVFINQFAIATTPGAREIIYVINNSGGGGSVNSQLTPNSRLSNRSLKKSNSKIGNERPLHIRTDLLPARLVKDGSCGGGGGVDTGWFFLPHQSQLKYVETVSLQCVDVEFNVLSPKRCQKSCNLPHPSQLYMLKRFLSAMCRCRILCDLPKRFQESCIYYTNHN